MEPEAQEGELGTLVSSPEFARMVDRFQATTGLKLQVFDLEAHPLTSVEEYPGYCRLQSEIAESNAQMLSQHIVDALLYLTRADYALVLMMDDNGSDLASGYDQPSPDALVEAKRRLVEGIAEWVKHADRTVTVPDISKSAWSRYLTDDAVKTGSIVGVPIPEQRGTSTFGAIVVGFDRAREELEEPLTAMQSFVTEGLYALVIGRKLIQAEQLALLDTQSGAYSQRFLEDLLENEISRASRHNHDLAV